MPDYLRISVRFLDGEFHGRGDGGANEWPPSPLRLFQALVAASAARWNERRGIRYAAPALRWLESLPPPTIIAPVGKESMAPYRLYVPDNVGDLVGKSWSKGNEGSIADYRTEKTVRPTHIGGEGAVHFLWPLREADDRSHLETLFTAARSITHLGWGVDLVVADASVIDSTAVDELEGATWQPTTEVGGTSLRTPQSGSFDDLERRHRAFLQRVTGIDGGTFSPVSPLVAFSSVDYRSDSDPVRPPVAIFALRQLDDSGYRSFDPVRRGLHVAAMLRHIVGSAEVARSIGWSDAVTARLVHGHDAEEASKSPNTRLLFLPLPSIEPRGQGKAEVVGTIRRIAIAASGGVNREQFSRLAQRLAGLELVDEKTGAASAVLARLPANDPLSQKNYLRASAFWTTVTPVILPGYDDPRKLRQRLRENSGLTAEGKRTLLDKLDQRIDLLLRKAIRQAGFSDSLARHAAIEWRGSGYLPGTDLASRYMAGDQHRRYRRLHVRIQFRNTHEQPLTIPGPFCLGSGKFSGTGLFAAVDR